MNEIDYDAVIGELQKGWTQGFLERHGKVCLLGAFHRARGLSLQEAMDSEYDEETCLDAERAVGAVIAEHFPDRFCETNDPGELIWSFNDHDDTTLDDVILVCEKARAASGELR